MLQHLPRWIGRAMVARRAGRHGLLIAGFPDIRARLDVTSPAFADAAPLPSRFTADGQGLSPPLAWRGAPIATQSFVLVAEDADAPSSKPLVHAILVDIPPESRILREGAIAADVESRSPTVGRNGLYKTGWLPPDPPPGHGAHCYVFQLFALDTTLNLPGRPGRGDVAKAMRGHILAQGSLSGTYER